MDSERQVLGSLQLAIDAGVDFPALLAALRAGETVPRSTIGSVRSRWILGGCRSPLPASHPFRRAAAAQARRPARLRAVCDFLRWTSSNDPLEVWRWRDPGPFLSNPLQWCGLLGRWTAAR